MRALSGAGSLGLGKQLPERREAGKAGSKVPTSTIRRYGLTARERETLRLVLEGRDNQNIASELQLTLGTVKAHVHNIFKKTGRSTRQDLIKDFWKG